MTQEEKELLLKDLSARLSYGVMLKTDNVFPQKLEGISFDKDTFLVWVSDGGFTLENIECKPYLFPLSSMTKEQTEEVHNLIYQGTSESVNETSQWLKTKKENDLRPITLTYILSDKLVIDWFYKNHFDYRGLIPMGLAIDATGLNIY